MKDSHKQKRQKRQRRAKRSRAKIFGTAKRPRLSIFRSNKHIYLQLIDDQKKVTLTSTSDLEIKMSGNKKMKELAVQVGQLIAKKAQESKINEAVFDKGGYRFHGIVKAAADGARDGGLKF
jgi:large subunit ribosomal protein L18